MTILTIANVRAAVANAQALHPDRDTAIAAASQALGVSVEVVLEAMASQEGTATC